MKPAIPGTVRHRARCYVNDIITDHVHGPVQLLPAEDVLELRKVLREKCPFFERYDIRVWREEIRTALGYADPKPRKVKKQPFRVPSRNVMPSMRSWAVERGILTE